VILVTDGQETTSKSTLVQAIEAARAARAAVYTVAIRSASFRQRPLRRLAHGTGGRYIEASSSRALKRIYKTIAAELGHTWRLQYLTAARPGDRIRLEVSAGRHRAAVGELVPGRRVTATGGGIGITLVLALIVVCSLLVFSVFPALRPGSLSRRRRGPRDVS
jgi:hypothetical protein